jgi:DNA-directed RNA polymerase III subunit RPC8
MFVLTTVADTVRVPPSLFLQPTLESVHQEIDKKYPNRVILDVGLVICRYGDAREVSEGICAPGDGAAFYEVVFQLIVFRPLVDEVCVGTIAESNEEGIRISLGEFFQDIFVPGEWTVG